MKNPNIATMLKYYRKLNELTVKDVSEQLKQHNNYAAPKTIYGWETGHTQPDADTLMLLCELYHIEDVLDAFGYRKNNEYAPLILSSKEKMLIKQYREKTEMQPAIDCLLDLK